ncbi:MAG: hypothetical protein IPM82_07600 [Saprospiraceae bacterium]|nr:hypothetical protein [Saprospiraceae bacterium]
MICSKTRSATQPATSLDENGVIVDMFDALKVGNADYQRLVIVIENGEWKIRRGVNPNFQFSIWGLSN